MKDSARGVPSSSGGQERSANLSFRWELPEGPVVVSLCPSVVDRLEHEAIKAFIFGRETHGVLLGRRGEGPEFVLIIEGHEALPVHNETGSESPYGNLQVVAPVLDRWRSSPSGRLQAVGFYRASAQKQLNLDAVELTTIAQQLTDRSRVFLLIQPHTARPSPARMYLSTPASVQPQPRAFDFQFHRAELGAPSTLAESLPPRSVPTAAIEPFARTRARFADRYRALILPGAVLLFCLLVWAGVTHFSTNSADSAPQRIADSGLGLRAEHVGGEWQVVWDRSSLPVRESARGRLSIADGYLHKEIELEPAELLTGKIVYAPLTDDVLLRLEVIDRRGQATVDSVHILSASLPAASSRPGRPDSLEGPTALGNFPTSNPRSRSSSLGAPGASGTRTR